MNDGITASKTLANCLYTYYYTPTVTFTNSSRLWYKWIDNELIDSTIALSKHLIKKYEILPSNIIGHSDITKRKCDPGPMYPWKYLYENSGIGAMPPKVCKQELKENGGTGCDGCNYKFELSKDLANHKSVCYMQKELDKYGYKIETKGGKLDECTKDAIKAFRMHYFIDEGLIDTPSVNAMYAIGSLNHKYIDTLNWKKDSRYWKLYSI